jgi:hypothetical protein
MMSPESTAPIASIKASPLRGSALLTKQLILAKASSIGLRSGE